MTGSQLLIAAAMAFSGGGVPPDDAGELPKALFTDWRHSHEEDSPDVKVFRPSSYKFPRSRGRVGFEIKKNGEFVQYEIAPTDGLAKRTGRWKAEGKDTITVAFDGADAKPLTIKIASLQDQVLKIKK
jgi:hypothetical protein